MTRLQKISYSINRPVNVPVWIITLTVPLLVSILIAIFGSIKVNANSTGLIQGTMNEMNKRLDRIEIKIDNHIESHKK